MPSATVTSKGQITNGEVFLRAKTKDFRSLVGKLHRVGAKPVSVEERRICRSAGCRDIMTFDQALRGGPGFTALS